MIQNMLGKVEMISSNMPKLRDDFHMINFYNLFYFNMYESYQSQFLLRNYPSGLNTNFEMQIT